MPKLSWFDVQVGMPEKIGSAWFYAHAEDEETAALEVKGFILESPKFHIEPDIHDVELNSDITSRYERLGNSVVSSSVVLVRLVEDLRLPDKEYPPIIEDFFADQGA